MTEPAPKAHPWMANALPDIRQAMLDEIGAPSVETLFEQIPAEHRLKTPLDLPPPLTSELELRRHLLSLLKRNGDCETNLSFLGAGFWQHHVPAVVDEIVGRTEFLTPVWGSAQSDHGRNQAWFEYASQLGELIDMDAVGLPVYSWGCAAGHAIRMAARITGRSEVLVPRWLDPERLSVIRSYCEPREMTRHIDVVLVEPDEATGGFDLADLKRKLSARTAAVYLEVPSYLGIIETDPAEIASLARAAGAETIVGADPISLGVLAPPGSYGADIVVGPTQPLGVHMNCGGGVGGYMATREDDRYLAEYNGFLVSIARTLEPGQYGFNVANGHQTSYGLREEGKDWTGNSVYLWAIANAVYMSLLGPEGFAEVGRLILARAHYAARQLDELTGVEVSFKSCFFKEFVVNFSCTGMRVAEINDGLRARGIFGGKDISAELPELGAAALYCVTEVHTKDDIDRLVAALKEVITR